MTDIAELINAVPEPGEIRTGTVTELVDATHVKVSIGNKVRTVFVGSAAVIVGQEVAVRLDGNVATLVSGGGLIPIAAVIDYFGATLPSGYLWADGTTFSAVSYPVLAAELGSTTLPDCGERVGVGRKAGSSFAGTLKATGGDADAIVVSHTHTYKNQSNTTLPPRGTGANWSVAAIADVSHNTGSAGSSGTNKNLQPFYVCNKIIRAF